MNIRKIALNILNKVDEGEYLQDLLIKEENSPLLYQITYGVVENQILLDAIIKKYSSISFSSIEKNTCQVLRMSLYQILYLDLPEFAIVNEGVELVNNRSKGFTNALLNSFVKEKDEILKKIKEYPLEIRYSMNPSLYKMLKDSYNKKTLEKILKESLEVDDFVISIREKKSEVLKTLKDNGYELEDIYKISDSFIVKNASGIFDLEEFKKGYFTIQKASSSLASIILNPQEGERILDLCAAPGGKTAHLSYLMKNTGEIVANDLYESKKERMEENFNRLNVNNVKLTFHDATKFIPEWKNAFDKILLDVPCSSTGRLSQYPEIKLFRTKEDVENLVKIQQMIIKNASKYLKEDGILVYSTCSILKEENEEQMETLKKYFSHKKINFYNPGDKFIKTLPFTKGMAGFFISKWEKKK